VQPTADEVRAQLERLLASDSLASSARLQGFLRHIVERTLEGEGGGLKEYAVGVEVFNRGDDYDPRIDSIVRVEAGRLRAKLVEYYNGPGASDEVIVRLPRGGYVPAFERRAAAAEPEAPAGPPIAGTTTGSRWRARIVLPVASAAIVLALIAWSLLVQRPRGEPAIEAVTPIVIAVLPFAHYSTDPAGALLAARITDGVRAELVRNPGLHVVSRTSSLQFAEGGQSLREVARALNADLLVEASVVEEERRVLVQARMVDPTVDRKFSVYDFEGGLQELDELQRRVAQAIVRAVR
jgi:adenylate cyclase